VACPAAYYLDVPFAEPLTRHATKADADYLTKVTERDLHDWYRERDLLPGGIETVIGADSALDATVDRSVLPRSAASARRGGTSFRPPVRHARSQQDQCP
jgi:hypothetical protein